MYSSFSLILKPSFSSLSARPERRSKLFNAPRFTLAQPQPLEAILPSGTVSKADLGMLAAMLYNCAFQIKQAQSDRRLHRTLYTDRTISAREARLFNNPNNKSISLNNTALNQLLQNKGISPGINRCVFSIGAQSSGEEFYSTPGYGLLHILSQHQNPEQNSSLMSRGSEDGGIYFYNMRAKQPISNKQLAKLLLTTIQNGKPLYILEQNKTTDTTAKFFKVCLEYRFPEPIGFVRTSSWSWDSSQRCNVQKISENPVQKVQVILAIKPYDTRAYLYNAFPTTDEPRTTKSNHK